MINTPHDHDRFFLYWHADTWRMWFFLLLLFRSSALCHLTSGTSGSWWDCIIALWYLWGFTIAFLLKPYYFISLDTRHLQGLCIYCGWTSWAPGFLLNHRQPLKRTRRMTRNRGDRKDDRWRDSRLVCLIFYMYYTITKNMQSKLFWDIWYKTG